RSAPAVAAAATAATATAETAPTAATTAAAGSLRLLDLDRASVQVGAVEPADGLFRFLGRRHLDEAEAARAAGIPVRHHTGRFDGARSRECFPQPLIGRREREASNEQFDRHEGSSFRGEGSTQRMRDLTTESIHWSRTC